MNRPARFFPTSAIVVGIRDSTQLCKDKEVPQVVGSGAIEMGAASLTRFAGDFGVPDAGWESCRES